MASPAGPAAAREDGERQDLPRVPMGFALVEVPRDAEDPEDIGAIRELTCDVLMDALDPRRDHTRTITPTTTEAVWYLSSYACHHIAGNLGLLNNLSPVSDRWVRCNESGPARQVLARGFVNCNGIILDDVWYVPGDVNLVSVSQLSGQSLLVEYSPDACIIKRNDGTVAGKAHVGPKNHFELDFMNTATSGAPWYIVSNVQEHMTGNLELLTDYSAIHPSHAVRTHTGAILQACGKGSLKKKGFCIPDISYVPGLNKNVVSISQLLDSGLIVEFDINGCIIKRNRDSAVVGSATYGCDPGLYRLRVLEVDLV